MGFGVNPTGGGHLTISPQIHVGLFAAARTFCLSKSVDGNYANVWNESKYGFSGVENMTVNRAGLCCVVAIVLHIALGNPSGYAQETAAAAETHRWAIIVSDPKMAAMADLLTADLAQWPRLELVERRQIQSVLDELRLSSSGLTAASNALQFGKLAKADALVLLDAHPQEKGPPAIRVRLVETRSAVRWLDVLLPTSEYQRDRLMIVHALQRVREKLTLSDKQRRYIGVMSIKTGEPGESLKAFCRTLTTVVETELALQPDVVVLEREQIQRLAAEQDLTGAELALRRSTRLLEASVQRLGDRREGIAISYRLHQLDGAQTEAGRVETEAFELQEATNKLVTSATRDLGARPLPNAAEKLADEANYFAQRRDWFNKAYRHEEAAEMAEVAMTLDPTIGNIDAAFSTYQLLVRANDGRLKSALALPAARRFRELRLQWRRKSPADSKMRRSLENSGVFDCHVRLSVEPESTETIQIRNESDQLALDFYDEILAVAGPTRLVGLIVERIRHLEYMSKTEEEFSRDFPLWIDKGLKTIETCRMPTTPGEGKFADFASVVWNATSQSVANSQPFGKSSRHINWRRQYLEPMWRQMAIHPNATVRAAGQYARIVVDRDKDPTVIKEFLTAARGWERVTNLQDRLTTDVMIASALRAIHNSHPEIEREYFEQALSRAENQGDARDLLRLSSAVGAFLGSLSPAEHARWSQRILVAVTPSQRDPFFQLDVMRMEGALRTNPPQQPPGNRNARFTLDGAPGAWSGYAARAIILQSDPLPTQSRLCQIAVDARSGRILLVWQAGGGLFELEWLDPSTGSATRFGPKFPGKPRAFHSVLTAIGDDAVYIASESPGLVRVTADKFEVLTEAEGAPSDLIDQMAWLDDRLYLAVQSGIAVYRPQTKRFTLLASSASLEQRNPFDGGPLFFVWRLIADKENEALWLNVRDTGADKNQRSGVWKLDAKTHRFTHLYPKILDFHAAADGLLLREGEPPPSGVVRPYPWSFLNTRTSELENLSQYAKWFPKDGQSFGPQKTFLRLGDHVITGDGLLFMPDGTQFRVPLVVPWTYLQPFGRGFITHYEPESKSLWVVEPKSEADPPAGAPDR
jgi:hypothetical protein